jgi:hypothetical protein
LTGTLFEMVAVVLVLVMRGIIIKAAAALAVGSLPCWPLASTNTNETNQPQTYDIQL